MAEKLLQNFLIVAPIFSIVFIGFLLKKLKVIHKDFIQIATRILFWACLPFLLFQKVAAANLKEDFQFDLVMICCAAVTGFAFFSLAMGWILGLREGRLGSFGQGAFRANVIIVSMAILLQTFPNQPAILAKAGILMGFYIPLLNLLAVFILILPHAKTSQEHLGKNLFRNIIQNPLILAASAGLVFAYFQITLPKPIDQTFSLLGQMGLPLGLLTLGAALDLKKMKEDFAIVATANLLKLLVLPGILLLLLKQAQFEPDVIKMVLIIVGAPTAVASYVMAVNMKGDGTLASNIVIFSTVAAVFSLTIWMSLV